MAEFTWPASLPQSPLLDGFRSQFQTGFIEHETDAGPRQRRRRFSATEDRQQMRMIMTAEQLSTLRNFYRTTLFEGSEAFNFIDYADPDEPTREFLFTSPPEATRVSHLKWNVAISLIRLPFAPD